MWTEKCSSATSRCFFCLLSSSCLSPLKSLCLVHFPLASNPRSHHQHSLWSLCSHSSNHYELQAGTHWPVISDFVVFFACGVGCADFYDADGSAGQADFVYVYFWIRVQSYFGSSDFDVSALRECANCRYWEKTKIAINQKLIVCWNRSIGIANVVFAERTFSFVVDHPGIDALGVEHWGLTRFLENTVSTSKGPNLVVRSKRV